MKRKNGFIFVFVLVVIMASPVYAKSGDILGKYYATDIKTYLNGYQIDAINIGGNTLISAEDMQYYGFAVNWYAQTRELTINEKEYETNDEHPSMKPQEKPAGTPIGYYYETDIVTYLDYTPITAYNIGGRTYIHAEAMQNFGYSVEWFADLRKLEITSPHRAGYVYRIPLTYGKNHGCDIFGEGGIDAKGVFSVTYTKDGIVGVDDADYFYMTLYASGRNYKFDIQFYQYQGLFNSTELLNRMRSLCHDHYDSEVSYDKEQFYDLVNQTVSISVNGQKAQKVSVASGAGNGHKDFYFTVHDLPPIALDKIDEIVFIFGEPDGEPYEILNP